MSCDAILDGRWVGHHHCVLKPTVSPASPRPTCARECPSNRFTCFCCPLRQKPYGYRNQRKQDQRRVKPVEVQATLGQRLVEKVANGGTQRPRENECRPEQQRVRDFGPQVQCGHKHQPYSEDQRTEFVAQTQAATIRASHPVAQRGAQCLGEHDRAPVKPLGLGCGDTLHRYVALGPIPNTQARDKQRRDDRNATGVTQTQ